MDIKVSIEGKRGCGYRKEGGLYLVGEGFSENCHRLPFELTVCPTCGNGVRPSRAWTWIDGVKLFKPGCEPDLKMTEISVTPGGMAPAYTGDIHCIRCVVCAPPLLVPQVEFKPDEEPPANFGMSGLIWVGEKYYRYPETFIAEANRMNICRRIKAVPRGFIIGETWVFLAHTKAVFNRNDGNVTYKPGIFRAYQPTAIEYVVKGDEAEKELAGMVKRGITPIRIEKKGITLDIENEVEPEKGPETQTQDHGADLLLRDVIPSRRAYEALEAHGLKYVREVISITVEDLMKLPGIGEKLAATIAEALALIDNQRR